MTKEEMIKLVRDVTGCNRFKAHCLLTSLFAGIGKDDKTTIRGLGTFRRVDVKPQKRINPRTGEEMILPANNALRFKAAKNQKWFYIEDSTE